MPAFRFGERIVLYFHVPKAGGTSIEAWLSEHAERSLYRKFRSAEFPLVPQHFHGDMITQLFAPDFFDYSFSVTRNPYARALSEYNYRITRPKLKNRVLPKPSFARWLRSTLSGYERNGFVYSNHIRPQHEFRIEGTEVFRVEDGLDDLRQRLTDVTGIALEAEIPRKNVSVKVSTSMTRESAEQIQRFYARDFDLFGYDPDSWRDLGAASPAAT